MNLNINDFSGPLDLLLYMVKKKQVDIYEIDLKIVIDEYIDFIDSLDRNDLDKKSEYLIMASELIHLKSKLLLGFDNEEEDSEYEINSEEDLRNKIIEYEKYKNISEEFQKLEENRQDYFTKIPENLREYLPDENLVNQMEIKALIEAFVDIQKRIDFKRPRTTRIARKEISIIDKKRYIKNILKEKRKIEFSHLFEDNSKEELVVTFLSILELCKSNEVKLSQAKNFSKIYIEVLDNE
ncbi:MAG: segregation/condensation protein A [Mollicutes bacterium]|nr:segregation/condensation protein A [Mollicutes bacterium]